MRVALNVLSVVSALAFALTWWLADIYVATAVLMGVMSVQAIATFIVQRSLPMHLLVPWLMVLFFGAITLILHDSHFIKMKTTVVYALVALVLVLSDYVVRRNLIKTALASVFLLPDRIWRRTSNALSAYCLVMATVNWWVASYLSEAAWVAIKTFGFPAVGVVVVVTLAVILHRCADKIAAD